MLDSIYIHHLQQNSWFSHLEEPFQQFVVEHGKKLVIEKMPLYSMLRINLMVYMVCLKVRLAWVTSMSMEMRPLLQLLNQSCGLAKFL